MKKYIYYYRTNDWLFSFIPFLAGLNYMWIVWYKIDFSLKTISGQTLVIFLLIGLATIGYLVNEFFDIPSDSIARKPNRLVAVRPVVVICLFVVPIILLFVPLIWLPHNNITLSCIGIELCLFLLYSAPLFRFKEVWNIAGIIDSLYAYVVPVLLSFSTFLLYTLSFFQWEFLLLIVTFFLCGYRNFILHQMKDSDFDERSAILTLPLKIGKRNTSRILMVVFCQEIALYLLSLGLLSYDNILLLPLFVSFVIYMVMKIAKNIQYRESGSLNVLYIEPNHFYQTYAPLICLMILTYSDLRWLFVLAFHLVFLTPVWMKQFVTDKTVNFVKGIYVVVECKLKLVVNYGIYYLFRVLGVNLIKEKKSALEYLKSKFENVWNRRIY